VVHGDKELLEKLGRKDPCPCGSARRFHAVLLAQRLVLTAHCARTISATDAQLHRHWQARNAADNRRAEAVSHGLAVP